MANIDQYLLAIMSAVYGEEVRGSIHDAIQAINTQVNTATQSATEAAQTAGQATASAAQAVEAANTQLSASTSAVQALMRKLTGFTADFSVGDAPGVELNETSSGTYNLHFTLKNGSSVTATVTPVSGGTLVSLTDENGTQSFTVLNGVSPTVSIQEIQNGTRVTITDGSGDHSFDITDGNDGGNNFYFGTVISGRNLTPSVYNTGIEYANVNDLYYYTGTTEGDSSVGNVYMCTTAGNQYTAKWVFAFNIRGASGSGAVNSVNNQTGNVMLYGDSLPITAGSSTSVYAAIQARVQSSTFTNHTGNTTVHVTAAERNTWNAKASASSVSELAVIVGQKASTFEGIVLLESDGWNETSEGSGLFVQTIGNLQGITADDSPVIDYYPPLTGPTEETYDAAAGVVAAETSAGAITFYCFEAPVVDFAMHYKVVR